MANEKIDIRRLVDEQLEADRLVRERESAVASQELLEKQNLLLAQAEQASIVREGFKELASLLLENEITPTLTIQVIEPRPLEMSGLFRRRYKYHTTIDTVVDNLSAWPLITDWAASGSTYYGEFQPDGGSFGYRGLALSTNGIPMEWDLGGNQPGHRGAVLKAILDDESLIPLYRSTNPYRVEIPSDKHEWARQMAVWGADLIA